MIPILTIIHAQKYLQENTPPQFRNQGRMDAMNLLTAIYKEFEREHQSERPSFFPARNTRYIISR